MPETHASRKDDHVKIAQKYHEKPFLSPFHDLHFVHHSVTMTNVSQIDLSTSFQDIKWDSPLYINAMTGGSEWTKEINEKLALVARETKIPMATGSASIATKDPATQESFEIVREVNPNGIVFGNLGAGHGVDNARRIVDLIEADAFQIHVNTAQEIVMPEGDRTFDHWVGNIEEIVQGLDVPVIVKEVGYGMSAETLDLLYEIGVQAVDVSGSGGTDFSQIENERRENNPYADLEGWGQTTPISLLEAVPFLEKMDILASGGIRQALDIVKSLALGARATGLSSEILVSVLDHGVDATIEKIEAMKEELRGIFALLGVENITELQNYSDLIITGQTKEWCEARDIDYKSFAKRYQNKL
jgi:isopentenyl-diphosphate delta-isomerase